MPNAPLLVGAAVTDVIHLVAESHPMDRYVQLTRPTRAPDAMPDAWPRGLSATVSDDDLDGLPMRVSPAHLAPQLHGAPSQEQREVSVRSPEELQQLMSSMQRGWQQGRTQVEQGHDTWNRKDGHSDAQPRS